MLRPLTIISRVLVADIALQRGAPAETSYLPSPHNNAARSREHGEMCSPHLAVISV